MFEIVNSLYGSDRITNFVALGNLLGENAHSYHSAFVIKYDNKLLEYHYTGKAIEYNELERNYFHKITDTIDPDEIPSFIAQCMNIQKKANPKYGFFYGGESYDQDGNHFSENDLGQRMTCVGFCLNVLKGFLEEDYIQFKDWTEDSHNEETYLTDFCAEHGINPNDVAPFHRRITPRELLISGFYIDLPITKAQIDIKQEEVQEYFDRIS